MRADHLEHIKNPPVDGNDIMRQYLENELNGYERSFELLKQRGKYAKLDYIRGRLDALKAALEILTIVERSND